MNAPLLQLEWNCYYYLLQPINGSVYRTFSPPGDWWALQPCTQLHVASARGTFPEAALSTPPSIRVQHRSRQAGLWAMQRHATETQREETLEWKAPLIYRNNGIWPCQQMPFILYPNRPSPLLSTSIIHCNFLRTTPWTHHVNNIVTSTEDLCSQNPHISHSKHSVTASQPTRGI